MGRQDRPDLPKRRGCTSDLNFYTTPEAATAELENMKKVYGDTTRYSLKQENF